MVPQGVEVRPDLQVRSDVLAFGFSGARVADQTVAQLLGDDLLDYILTAAEKASAGLVVVDLRNVDSLSATAVGRLLALYKRLSQAGWQLILLISDPVLRAFFATTHLDRAFLLAVDEAELRELVQRRTPIPAQTPPDRPPEFSEGELAEMEAGGITLDDAIRLIEGLRG